MKQLYKNLVIFFHIKTIFFYSLFLILYTIYLSKNGESRSDLEMVSILFFRNAWILYLKILNCPPLQTASIKPILNMAKWGSNIKISLFGRAVWQVQQEAIKSCGSIIHSEHNRLLFIIFFC